MRNRFSPKTNFVQYLSLTKALQNYVKLLDKQLTKICNKKIVCLLIAQSIKNNFGFNTNNYIGSCHSIIITYSRDSKFFIVLLLSTDPWDNRTYLHRLLFSERNLIWRNGWQISLVCKQILINSQSFFEEYYNRGIHRFEN